ncbi:MAG: PQQ-binding-like beta-propeller repeat protein [bacterium]
MKSIAMAITILYIAFLLAWHPTPTTDAEKYWPQWRGPYATGVAPHGNPPIEWSESKNIRWKIEIPGKGSSSPIVWGNAVFVTSAIAVGEYESQPLGPPQRERRRGRRGRRGIQPSKAQKFTLFAIHRQDGKILWQRTARTHVPHEGTHQTGTWASNSAITDGEHVYAYFGSNGLYCYDMQGDLKWQKDLGDMRTRNGFGEGSSPALYGNMLILNWDHEEQSFIIALDKNTGREIWKANRDEVTSWSTPIVVEHNGKAQVIVNATGKTRGYDLKNGEVIWECDGMTLNTIPSPVFADGILYVTSGFRGNMLQAIRLAKAKGEITGSDAIIWQYERDTPYVPSPLLYGEILYFLKSNNGILSCFDAKTGEVLYKQQRLKEIQGVYASPVGASNRVYLAGRNGAVAVIKHGKEFEVLATNKLDDGFDASPAIVEDEIYLRGYKYLYCVAEE